MKPISRLSNDGHLDELVRRAQAAFDALTPEQQAEHRFEQRVSWVYGQLALSGRDVTKESVRERLVAMRERGEL